MAKHIKGVAVRGINLSDVKLIPVMLPELGEQRAFSRRATVAETLNRSLRATSSELHHLFASLQHRAFTGQL